MGLDYLTNCVQTSPLHHQKQNKKNINYKRVFFASLILFGNGKCSHSFTSQKGTFLAHNQGDLMALLIAVVTEDRKHHCDTKTKCILYEASVALLYMHIVNAK